MLYRYKFSVGVIFKMAFILKNERKETENKTIRFPLELIKKIESVLEGTEVSFSRFVIQACEYALKEMNDNKQKQEKN